LIASLDVIGFGSLNIDEFWEVPSEFLTSRELRPGDEYVRDVAWFERTYPELSSQGDRKAVDPGGSAANMIAALRRMGMRTGFFGAAGAQDADLLRLEELGDAPDLRIERGAVPSGRCLALIAIDDPTRDRALVIVPNANDVAGAAGFDPNYFGFARWVHLTSFVNRGPLSVQIEVAQGLPEATRVSFDPGVVYCRRGWLELEPLLRRTAVLFVTDEELALLGNGKEPGSVVAGLLELGVGTVVVKRGREGISGFRRGEHLHQPAIPPAAVVDRTGAGDVAAAGFIAGMLLGRDLGSSLELAAAAASRSIEAYGRTRYPDASLLGRDSVDRGACFSVQEQVK
jgi:ribokinase